MDEFSLTIKCPFCNCHDVEVTAIQGYTGTVRDYKDFTNLSDDVCTMSEAAENHEVGPLELPHFLAVLDLALSEYFADLADRQV